MYRHFHEHPRTLVTVARDADKYVREWVCDILSCHPFPEFCEAVRDEINSILSGDSRLLPHFVRAGIYHEQLLRYYEYFDRDQVFIIDSLSLRSNTASVLSEVTQFLEIPEYGWSLINLPLYNVRESEPMPDETRGLLREFYKPWNEKLYELVGRDFGLE
jgi:hypothetical protein